MGAVGFMAFGPSIVKKVEMEEMAFVFWRLGIAAAFYTVVLVLAGNRLRWIDLKRSAVGGVIFAVNLVFFILSMRRTSRPPSFAACWGDCSRWEFCSQDPCPCH